MKKQYSVLERVTNGYKDFTKKTDAVKFAKQVAKDKRNLPVFVDVCDEYGDLISFIKIAGEIK